MVAGALDNLLINGDFPSCLWGRVRNPGERVACPVWRQTFAADRWKVRYARAEGGAVTQAMSNEAPAEYPAEGSLEIQGSNEVTQNVFVGQRIEAAESARYRRRLIFSAWIFIANEERKEWEASLVFSAAQGRDFFGECEEEARIEHVERLTRLASNRWTRVECEVDGRAFSPNGLSVEIEFPVESLQSAAALIRVTGVRLADVANAGAEMTRPAAMEALLAKRFFQRHDAGTLLSLGRAVVANNHELHFQFSFTEMRGIPVCTLPKADEHLRVFDLGGVPQNGFIYDVTHRSRASVFVRATKPHHGVRDGYLSLVGEGGAILLDAEL